MTARDPLLRKQFEADFKEVEDEPYKDIEGYTFEEHIELLKTRYLGMLERAPPKWAPFYQRLVTNITALLDQQM